MCTGNTCRSAMAKALYQKRCEDEGIKFVGESAGIYVPYPDVANKMAVKAMQIYNIDLSNHIATQITKEDILNSKVILTMTDHHKQILINNISGISEKVFTFYEYVFNEKKDVEDPYGKDFKEYIKIAEELKTLVNSMKLS